MTINTWVDGPRPVFGGSQFRKVSEFIEQIRPALQGSPKIEGLEEAIRLTESTIEQGWLSNIPYPWNKYFDAARAYLKLTKGE
jgi:hypothetical protein